jgi:6-phosphogluconolactonase
MSLSHWLSLLGLAVAVGATAQSAPAQETGKDGKLWVFVGTYTGGKAGSKGIYRLELDLATGKLSEPALAAQVTNPSFLAIHPTRRSLYAVSEVSESGGKRTGAVAALALDPATGSLKVLNYQPSGGAGPCHVSVDRTGKCVLVANYGGGSASAIPVAADGQLQKPSAVVQHKGSSVDTGRQEAPHAHSINIDPANKFAFVADLGLDRVMVYRFDADKGSLTPNDPPAADLKPGAGPRHFAFHPSGKYAYVINELDSTLTAFAYDGDRGVLTILDTVPTLPKPHKGNSTAEVVVHPSGKFVYGSNRGHNSIAIFRVDEATGKLTPAGHQGEGIKTPRNFVIDPTGRFLIVANQDSNSLVVFRIDAKTGALAPTGVRVAVPVPVCVRMMAKS